MALKVLKTQRMNERVIRSNLPLKMQDKVNHRGNTIWRWIETEESHISFITFFQIASNYQILAIPFHPLSGTFTFTCSWLNWAFYFPWHHSTFLIILTTFSFSFNCYLKEIQCQSALCFNAVNLQFYEYIWKKNQRCKLKCNILTVWFFPIF